MNSPTFTRIASPLLFVGLFLMAGWLTWHAHADSITLTTGEIISGTIVSETTTNLEIELSKYRGVVRIFEKSQIQTDSIRRNPGNPVKVSSLFSTNIQAAEAQESHAPFSFTGNAFDFVIWLSKIRHSKISIDPSVVGELAKSEVQIVEATIVPTAELLETQMKLIGLIVRPVVLAPNLTVSFITSPSAWAYYSAISCSRTGDIQSAYSLLVNAKVDNSEFGYHCTGFKAVLDKIFQHSREMSQVESEVKQSIANFKNAETGARSFESMSRTIGLNGRNDMAQFQMTSAARLLQQAKNEAARVWQGLNKFYDNLVNDNGGLVGRFRETETAHLEYEPSFILNSLVAVRMRFQNLVDQTLDATGAATTDRFDKETNEIRDLQNGYTRTLTTIDGAVRSAGGMVTVNPERAGHTYSEAYAMDRSSLPACVGCGYCKVLKQIKGLDTLANLPGAPTGKSLIQIYEQEFRNQQRTRLLQVLSTLNHQTTNQTVMLKPGKIGSTKGLAVRLGEGDIFGISVTIEKLTHHTPGTASAKLGYWAKLTEQLREAELTDEPLEFGDYGTKDSDMIVSAIQAYKWLKTVDGVSAVIENNKGLKIEFHNIFGGKGGDSAGVTFGTSAFAAIKQVEVRQDIAMTGSIRADGSVKAVGAVPEKISGAVRESGIETIIVPYENRLDLLAVPADQLCRVAIITGNDIRDYLRHATLTATNEAATEKWEAQNAVIRLRFAQVLLLMGERTVARELLEAIASDHPEVYNAKRLLELLNKVTNPDAPQVEQIISREQAEKIIRQLNPLPMLPPGKLSAIPDVHRIHLTWSPSPEATAYVVQRIGESAVHVTTAPAFVDDGLSQNVQYCYSIIASNNFGISPSSPQICVTTRVEQTVQAPPAPQPDEPWWKKYWYILAGLILVVGYFAFRSPSS